MSDIQRLPGMQRSKCDLKKNKLIQKRPELIWMLELEKDVKCIIMAIYLIFKR